MMDLGQSVRDIAGIFDAMGASYVVMGGIAVRIYGIPRPTHDVDFTVALRRDDLPKFFDCASAAGYTVPEPYRQGWVDQVAGMPLVKLACIWQGMASMWTFFLPNQTFSRVSWVVVGSRNSMAGKSGSSVPRIWFC